MHCRHLTDIPTDSMYSGVVSLHGLCIIAFLLELNGLESWATNVGNAYLEAYMGKKLYIIAGPELENLKGISVGYGGMNAPPIVYGIWDLLHPRPNLTFG